MEEVNVRLSFSENGPYFFLFMGQLSFDRQRWVVPAIGNKPQHGHNIFLPKLES